jgi:hypothetical protein
MMEKEQSELPPKIASLVRCGCCRTEWEPKAKKGFRDNGTATESMLYPTSRVASRSPEKRMK